jgi:hypothetical protein
MDDLSEIIFGNLSLLEKKGHAFIYGIEDRVKASLEFIQTKYKNLEQFNRSINFERHLSEAVKADLSQLFRVGFFPVNEAEMELDHSIKHALIGSYKSAFADLRRALELILVSVYFTSEKFDDKEDEAVKWVESENNTPSFSKMLKELIKTKHFEEFNNKHSWEKKLKEFYWSLSDFSHNKGAAAGYLKLNKTHLFTLGTSVPSISYETLERFCDNYIKTVEEIIVLLVLYNPVILVGVPLDEKFGLEAPISGFFQEGQAELVHELIPCEYKNYFKELAEQDDGIASVLAYFHSLPDLTEKDIEEQIERQEDFFDKFAPS